MFFWIGLVLGGALMALVYWLRDKNVTVRWYEWLLGFVAVLAGAMAVQHYTASSANESTSALLGGLLFGGLALVLALIVYLLIWRRQRA
jgi:hypothetical protein